MDAATLIYLVCFGVGLVFAVVSAFLADCSGGHDTHFHAQGHAHGHAEAGCSGHDMPGFAPLSPTTIASFITAFGGFGLIFSRLEWSHALWISLPLAVLGGLSIAAFVFFVFSKVFRATQGSSEGRVAELFGRSATVITPIADGGVGQIAYVQGGTRYTAPARANDPGHLANGEKVRIVRIIGTEFFVCRD